MEVLVVVVGEMARKSGLYLVPNAAPPANRETALDESLLYKLYNPVSTLSSQVQSSLLRPLQG
jgi:hypothetical protein